MCSDISVRCEQINATEHEQAILSEYCTTRVGRALEEKFLLESHQTVKRDIHSHLSLLIEKEDENGLCCPPRS
jgi:hypothetical protein